MIDSSNQFDPSTMIMSEHEVFKFKSYINILFSK